MSGSHQCVANKYPSNSSATSLSPTHGNHIAGQHIIFLMYNQNIIMYGFAIGFELYYIPHLKRTAPI